MSAMRTLALLVAVPAALAYGQTNPEPAASPAAVAQKTVEQTASPELVGQLVNELGISAGQAEGAAGTLFGVAKSRLGAEDFAKVASTVPNIDGLLNAAPAADPKAAALEAVAGKTGGVASMAAAAGTLSKLGLNADTITKLAPTLVKLVQSKGGAEVGALLAGALK
jgi:hypothetical protein